MFLQKQDIFPTSLIKYIKSNRQLCDNCAACSVYTVPSCEIRMCAWYLVGFWEPVPHDGLLCPDFMQVEEISPAAT